jgi:hypothetical protein
MERLATPFCPACPVSARHATGRGWPVRGPEGTRARRVGQVTHPGYFASDHIPRQDAGARALYVRWLCALSLLRSHRSSSLVVVGQFCTHSHRLLVICCCCYSYRYPRRKHAAACRNRGSADLFDTGLRERISTKAEPRADLKDLLLPHCSASSLGESALGGGGLGGIRKARNKRGSHWFLFPSKTGL